MNYTIDHDTRSVMRIAGATPDTQIDSLHVIALEGEEQMNSLFEYHVTVQTPLRPEGMQPPQLAVAEWLGRELTVLIELDGQGTLESGGKGPYHGPARGRGIREISGIVTQAAVIDADARQVAARLTLRPWLFEATLSSNCRVFQDLDCLQILDLVLQDYLWPVEKRLSTQYPPRDQFNQFNETDYEYFLRVTQEWGINHHFEHRNGRHTLVLSDSNGAFKRFQSERTQPHDLSPYHAIPIHPAGHRIDREYIHAFQMQAALTSMTWRAHDYDYMRPAARMLAHGGIHPVEGQRAPREIYTWRGDHAGHGGADWAQPDAGVHRSGTNPDQANLPGSIRIQAIEQHAHRGSGAGHIRGVVTGHFFRLEGHAQDAANIDHLVIGTVLRIQSPGQTSQSPETNGSWQIETRFITQKLRTPLRPDVTQPKPRIHGVECAIVTGPPGSDLYTDVLHRVKVRFLWDRSGRKDQTSSCWVRVATPLAGNQLGATFVPRVRQEVTVAFYGGDPDLPVIIGSVHNGFNHPAWQLPANSGLSGFRTRELGDERGNGAAGRSNHLAFDDSAGNIQLQLKSDHLHSQLSLGALRRIEDHQGRKDPRGEGFELRTDGVGALRSGRGMLVSTDAREQARSHLQDTSEATRRLDSAVDLGQTLGQLARHHEAQDADVNQQAVNDKLKAHNDEIAGRPGAPQTFGQLARPHLALSAAASLAAAAETEIQIAAGGDVSTTSGGHTSLSAGSSLMASARDAIRMFAQRLGIRIFAAQGPVQIQAQDDRLELIARKALELMSTTDWLRLRAAQGIALGVGDTTLHITPAGFSFHTPGAHHVWAADHQTFGPRALGNPLPPLPQGVCVPCLLKAARAGSALSGY